MVFAADTTSDRLVHYIRKHAPFSVVELGTRFAREGRVLESSKIGEEVRAIVRDDGDVAHSVSLQIISDHEVESNCSCSSREDLVEQWCPHVVALVLRAHELGFFTASSGFAAKESTYRLNTSSSAEIAAILAELPLATTGTTPIRSLLKVTVELETSTDRLGVKIFFDGTPQTPALFEGFRVHSRRALDNILLQILEEEGSWDDLGQRWYINSSSGIEIVLGLVEEYQEHVHLTNGNRVHCAHELIDARVEVEWHQASVSLSMTWLLPDGTQRPKQEQILGTGPFWVALDNVIYKLSARAARIASIFPHAPHLTFTRTQAAPLLEVLNQNPNLASVVSVLNPAEQPEAMVAEPSPRLTLTRIDEGVEHFSSKPAISIRAQMDFRYPPSPSGKNLIYLPNRSKEQECFDILGKAGFVALASKSSFTVSGDYALDLLSEGAKRFPKEWDIEGLDALRKGSRFVELSLNVNLSSPGSVEAKGAEKKRSVVDWFDVHVSLTQNNATVPISTLFKGSRSDSDRWMQLDSGAYARVPGGSLGHLKTTLGLLDGNFKLSNAIRSRLSMAQAFNLSRISEVGFKVSLDERLREVAKKLEDFHTIRKLKVSKGFHGKLRNYQEEGLSWLYFLHELSLGGILADEMGLGKTVQALSLIQYLKDRKMLKHPVMIVAPTSVITNWTYEAKRFAPQLKVLLLHGAQRKAHFAEIAEYDLVITSYALLRLDRYEHEKVEFDYVILDESQNIKNPDAATTKAAKALRAHHRLALTGTPTENRPLELWSIIDFLNRGYLGSIDYFRNYVERPILEATTDNSVAEFLHSKIRPFVLRRKKAEVERDLPPKVESVLHVEMTESQQTLYQAILNEVRPRVFDAIKEKGVRGASISILAALLRLRQVCNHPNSIDSLKHLPGYESGKFNLLKELVTEAVENGRKILLFSQFREMLNIIRRWLEESSINHLYLDGSTKNRQELIDQFNSDEKVRLFLISLKAGGTGLNLTAADTVIIYDPWWNPAVEGQAVDRAHRIGQSKTVSVYRLVTENSVEQKIMDLKAKKAKIVEALLQSEESMSVLKLSKGDLEQIFSPLPKEE